MKGCEVYNPLHPAQGQNPIIRTWGQLHRSGIIAGRFGASLPPFLDLVSIGPLRHRHGGFSLLLGFCPPPWHTDPHNGRISPGLRA